VSTESPLTADDAATYADLLYDARRTRTAIAPFTDTRPGLGLDDGYAIQEQLVERLLRDGDEIIGYKLGLTSLPMQQLLGVDQPDLGPVLASTLYRNGDSVDLASYIAPRVEAEIGVVLDRPLRGPGCTVQDVVAATRGLVAAIEIVDSRISDWRIKLADTVADLASNGALAVSQSVVPLSKVPDARLVGMMFSRNGELLATGAGAAAMGNPLEAVAWLANTIGPKGISLQPGHVILTGALHAMVPVAEHDVFVAEFDHLGSLRLTIEDSASS
jgi:2-keto-4-pentenoate hydratase